MEKIAQAAAEWWREIAQALGLAAVGILMAIGQILMSKQQVPWRVVIGRCITTGGLSMAAGMVLLAWPDAPRVAQFGVAAALATLGTAGLERLIQRTLGTKGQS